MKVLVFRIAVITLLVKIVTVVAPYRGNLDMVVPLALASLYLVLELLEMLTRK